MPAKDQLEKDLAQDPYREPGPRLLALRLPVLPTLSSQGYPTQLEELESCTNFAEQLWSLIRQAIFYWTPARIEHEALRRAGDQPGTSVIAEEAALFTVAYQKWLWILLNWESAQRAREVRHYTNHLYRAVLMRTILAEDASNPGTQGRSR